MNWFYKVGPLDVLDKQTKVMVSLNFAVTKYFSQRVVDQIEK